MQINNETIMKYNPFILIDFYESKIISFNPPKFDL